MGNSAVVFIRDEKDPYKGVYLYTHWGANRLLSDVRRTLQLSQRYRIHKGKPRWWLDTGCIGRVLLNQMGGNAPASPAGLSAHDKKVWHSKATHSFGIYTSPPANDSNRLIEIGPIGATDGLVLLYDSYPTSRRSLPIYVWKFEEFCRLSGAEMKKAWRSHNVSKIGLDYFEGLKEAYDVIRESEEDYLGNMLFKYPQLHKPLLELRSALSEHFTGKEVVLSLGSRSFDVSVRMEGTVEEAMALLDSFDNSWWLENYDRFEDKVCVLTEYVR